MSPLDQYRQACHQAVAAAKDKLTIADLWDMAPFSHQSAPPARCGEVVKSPLREDKKGASFTLTAQGHAFVDHARDGVKGGVWEFVLACRPDMPPGEVARLLVSRAHAQWPDKAAFLESGKLAPVEDPAALARVLREKRLEEQKDEKSRADREERERRLLRNGVGPLRHGVRQEPWPVAVALRWNEGADYRDSRPDVVAALCAKRGWPVEWQEVVTTGDFFSFPLEPRYEPGQAGAKRMVAFRVEMPVVKGATATLLSVGYHQKFFNVIENRSGWRFLPCHPKKDPEKCSSYEYALGQEAERREIEAGQSMVAPLPFVIGKLSVPPRLVIIVEGQWDALTMYGALGGFNVDAAALEGVVVFGIRGAKNTAVFFEQWGAWLKAVKPLVWVLPDNDAAAGGWCVPSRASERVPGKVYFAEQLSFAGAERVVVTPLKMSAEAGKDFNDYYRAAQPTTAAMWDWVTKLNLTF